MRNMSQVRQAGMSARGTGTKARQNTAELMTGTGTGIGTGIEAETAVGTRTATPTAREATTGIGGGIEKTATETGVEVVANWAIAGEVQCTLHKASLARQFV